MNTTLTIKNFRVFDENGVDVQLSPITILTGCNSSGKSSIVKAALLLDSFLKQIKRDYEKGERIRIGGYKLDFSAYPNNMLGRYDKIVNNKSESKRITFAYTVYSLMLSKEVNVEFVFNTDKNDELNNGFLENFTLSTEDGVIYSSGKNIRKICNLNLIKEDAAKLMLAEWFMQNYSSACVSSEIDGSVSEQEISDLKEKFKQLKAEIGKERVKDAYRFLRKKDKGTILDKVGCKPEVLEWTLNNSSYFRIPLLDFLKDCGKEEIKSKVTDEVYAGNNVSEQLQEAFDRVVKDFVNSGYRTFGEYFRAKETDFMENTVKSCFTPSPFSFDDAVPSVCIKEFFRLPQNYFFDDPRKHEPAIASFGISKTDDPSSEGDTTEWPEGYKWPSHEDLVKKWLDIPINFPILYELLMGINSIYTHGGENAFYNRQNRFECVYGEYSHYAFRALEEFAYGFVVECILPSWGGSLSYVGSSRTEVKRLYPLDDMSDFTQLLHRYFEGKRAAADKAHIEAMLGKIDGKEYSADLFTKLCLKRFGIGESLVFKVDEDGLGMKIFLHRSDGTEDRLLADEGYGITQLVSIILQIETAILTAKEEKVRSLWGIKDPDGYDSLDYRYEQQTIAIEEPEIHLHPRLQSLLAEMFVVAYKKYNIHFIIETHSEYLIRKMQLLVANEEIASEDVSLLYVYDADESKRPEGEPQIKDIGICSDGYLNESFGPGFFDEASSLSRQLLK